MKPEMKDTQTSEGRRCRAQDHYGLRLTRLRDRHFMEACSRLLNDPRRRFASARELAAAAASEPAPLFYISFERALRVVRHYRSCRSLPEGRGQVRAKWVEIIDRTERLIERYGISDTDALVRVLENGAPSFFLHPSSALRLYHRLRHRRRRPTPSTDLT